MQNPCMVDKNDTCQICCPDDCEKCADRVLFESYVQYNKIRERHKKIMTKRKRTIQLAEQLPRKRNCKFDPPIFKIKRYVKLYREIPMNTHTEQLAFPQVRKLLETKKRYKNTVCKRRYFIFNRHIRNSLLSYYSLLANVKPLKKPPKRKKWSKADWSKHTRPLKALAMPKVRPSAPPVARKRKELSKIMQRVARLALPKLRPMPQKIPWVYTKTMRKYKTTDRTRELGRHREIDVNFHYKDPQKVSPGALKYKPSPRMLELSKHRSVAFRKGDVKEHAFEVAKEALKAKCSKRTKELAKPRDVEEPAINEGAFTVSKKALKAKPTPRLIEMSKPRGKS